MSEMKFQKQAHPKEGKQKKPPIRKAKKGIEDA